MAYQLTEWVQNDTPKAGGNDKCVLYALAHRIPFGQAHWTCFADQLSAWTGIPERTLRDCCTRLEKAGYLVKEGKGGRRKDGSGIPTTYRLVGAPMRENQVGENRHVEKDKAADAAALSGYQGGENRQHEPGKSCHQEGGNPRHQRRIEQSEKEYVPDGKQGFSEFFEKYPRPGDLEATEEAYEAALADGVSHSDLMAALKHYCEDNGENIEGGKRQCLKYSDSWLTDRYFERYRGRGNDKPANPDLILEQRAKSIREGHLWIGRHVSAACARELVARGMVTTEQCRAVGLQL